MKVKYYLTPGGRSPVEGFILSLPQETRLEIADAVALLEDGQTLRMPLSRNLSGIKVGLHELRFRDRAGQIRVIYYFKRGEAIYFVHAFRKKTQVISSQDVELILRRLREI